MPKLSFSPPDITEEEISAVSEVLRSGWITTGPKTKQLEDEITEYTGSNGCVCLNSATAGMEMVLRLFNIGEGDEVITTPYTYSATAAVILHVGATPVFADVKPGSFNIDPQEIERKITERTKAIIPVDVGGYPCDYDEIYSVVTRNNKYNPAKDTLQENLGRILVLADAAHSIGAMYKGTPVGSVADFTVFSFHAVKNVTTAEGGAITFRDLPFDTSRLYSKLRTLSLHGQSKDALKKTELGSWEYDIFFPGFKCNMTDISAALGLVQLHRYKNELKERREEIFRLYRDKLNSDNRFILPDYKDDNTVSSCHLFMLRIKGIAEAERNRIIKTLAKKGIPLNVHYKPLPLLTCYKDLGYRMDDYPNAYNQYKNQITLPLHTLLTNEDIDLITDSLLNI